MMHLHTRLAAVLLAALLPAAAAAAEQPDIRAQLLPRQYTTMAAEVGARIDRLPLREGDNFKRGDLLVGFDCSSQQAQLNKASAELSAARLTRDANERLATLKSIGKLELDLSRAAVQKAAAEVGLQKTLLAKCEIRAPFAGRMSTQQVRNQQFVQPGQELLEIIDDSVLELEFLVPSSWLPQVQPGRAFQVLIDETGKAYPARFTRLGARIDPVSQSIKVVAAIDGKFPELITGMSGRVLLDEAAPAARTD